MSAGNPFDEPGEWYRANLHAHSTSSDGLRTPAEAVGWYQEHGYHILALTDHNRPAESALLDGGRFLQLGGIEVDGIDPDTGLYHLVGLGPCGGIDCHAEQRVPAQVAVDGLREAGALALLAHPYWSANLSKDLLRLRGICGMEIYNASCEVINAKGLSTAHWDDLLGAGRRAWGVATDDSHEFPDYPDSGLGWVWIKAPALAPDAVLLALEHGHFYASSGPQIHDFRVADGRAAVRCSPATIVDFVGPGCYSQRVAAPAGGCLSEVICRLAEPERQQYVRVACQDEAGKWAWSNPVFLS